MEVSYTSTSPSSSRSRNRTCRVIVSVSVLLILIVVVSLLTSVAKPTIRGFFCNDDSIAYPKKPNTVTVATLFTTCIGLPLLIILLLAVIAKTPLYHDRNQYKRVDNPIACGLFRKINTSLSWSDLLWHCYCFLLGFTLVLFFTETSKLVAGRLRPYFLDACQPDYSKLNCTNEEGFPLYILHPECQGKNENEIQQARLSWPSGHASISVFSGVFVMLYLEVANIQKFSSPLKALLQVIPATLALLCSLSRISDNAHHWSDVLSGAILGASIAVAIMFMMLSPVWINRDPTTSTVDQTREIDDDG